MNYIVLDLEWNQAAYKTDEEIDIPFEIIEIGAVKLNRKAEILDSFQELIRPQVYPFLLRRTKQLTGWTDRDLDERGIYFEDAIEKFLKWCGRDYVFCVWGGSDLTQLERNMSYYNIRVPWKYPLKYLDVQKLFALEMREGKTRRPLEAVVEHYGIPADRPFHHALDDATYTAKIFQKLDRAEYESYYSVDYYRLPKNRFEEVTFHFKTYSKFVSRKFNLKEEVIRDLRVRELRCRICGRKLHREVNWFTDGHSYFALGTCREHGKMRGRIRIRRTENQEGYFAIRTIKNCNSEEEKKILDKQDNLRARRRERRQRGKGTEEKE